MTEAPGGVRDANAHGWERAAGHRARIDGGGAPPGGAATRADRPDFRAAPSTRMRGRRSRSMRRWRGSARGARAASAWSRSRRSSASAESSGPISAWGTAGSRSWARTASAAASPTIVDCGRLDPSIQVAIQAELQLALPIPHRAPKTQPDRGARVAAALARVRIRGSRRSRRDGARGRAREPREIPESMSRDGWAGRIAPLCDSSPPLVTRDACQRA